MGESHCCMAALDVEFDNRLAVDRDPFSLFLRELLETSAKKTATQLQLSSVNFLRVKNTSRMKTTDAVDRNWQTLNRLCNRAIVHVRKRVWLVDAMLSCGKISDRSYDCEVALDRCRCSPSVLQRISKCLCIMDGIGGKSLVARQADHMVGHTFCKLSELLIVSPPLHPAIISAGI